MSNVGPDGVVVPIVVDTGDSAQQITTTDDAIKGLADSAKGADAALIGLADANDIVVISTDRVTKALLRKRAAAGEDVSEAKAQVAAQEDVAAATDAAAASADRNVAALDAEAAAYARTEAAAMTMAATQEEVAANVAAANAALGSTYAGMSKLEMLGTPALMKAATWSVLGVGGIAYEGIKQYMNFNKLITQTITQAGQPASNMGYLTNMTESISKMTGVGLTDVANNLYRVASGTASWNNGLGATKKQLADIVTSVTKLQVLGNVPAGAASEQAARVITALVNSNIVGVGRNPDKAAALINAAVGSGDMRLNDLVPGIGRGVLQSAKANGLSAQDMLSWIALQTSMGTTANVAGNYVKTGINLLANPSAQGVLAEAMIGIKPGEMQGIMSGPGGLQQAVEVFDNAIKHFAPASGMVSYRTPEGFPRPQSPGIIGAINKLQTWMVGEMNPTVLKQWEHGGSAASGGLTAKNLQWVQDLIMTKAFGGSKQFATLAAILKNPQLLSGIESSIQNKSSLSYFNSSYGIAAMTPSQRFHKDLASIEVDLVKAGQALYPITIKLVDGFTWFVGKLVSWKPALFEIGAAMLAIVGFAALVKAASIGKSAMALYGGILTKFDPQGTNMMHFRNAYQYQSVGTMADIGEQVRKAGIATQEQIKVEGTGIEAAVRDVGTAEVTALNEVRDMIAAGSGLKGGTPGGGSLINRTAAGGSSTESTIVAGEAASASRTTLLRDPVTGRMMSAEASAAAMSQEANAASLAAYYGYNDRRFQAVNPVTGAFMGDAQVSARASRIAEISNLEAMGAAQNASINSSMASIAARGAGRSTGYPGYSGPMPYVLPSDGWSGAAKEMSSVVPTVASDVSKVGILSRIGSLGASALDLVGGPVGIAMLVATVMPLAMPYMIHGISALGGVIGRWLSGSSTPQVLKVPTVDAYSRTQSQLSSSISSYQKQIATMNKGGFNYATATPDQLARYFNLHGALSSTEMALKNLSPAAQMKEFKAAWSRSNDPQMNALMGLTSTGSSLFSELGTSSNLSTAWLPNGGSSRLISAFRGYNGPGAAVIHAMLAGTRGLNKKYSYLQNASPRQVDTLINSTLSGIFSGAQRELSTPEAVAALQGNKIIPDFAGYMAAEGKIRSQANYGNLAQSLTLKGLTTKNYKQRYGSAEGISAALSGIAVSDMIRSKAPGTSSATAELYRAASKRALEEAQAFDVLRNEMANKLNGQKLDKGSMKDLATEITNQQRDLYKALGISAVDFGKAFASALSSQSSTLASMINAANSRVNGTGAKPPAHR
jgi:hypothetical protein